MEPTPNRHQMPMQQQQHLVTQTLDDTAQRQSAPRPSAHFHVGQHEAGADVPMHGISPSNNPSLNFISVPAPRPYQYAPIGDVGRPLTPPRQYDEEYSPLYQQNAHYHQYDQYGALPAPTPHRPSDYRLQSQYTSDYLPAHCAPQDWNESTALPTRSPSFAGLLQSQTGSTHAAPQAAPPPPLRPPVQEWPTHNLAFHHAQPIRISNKPNSSLSLEEEIRRKQEIYREKGARKRQRVQEQQQNTDAMLAQRAAYAEMHRSSTSRPSTKRKKHKTNNMIQDLVAPLPISHLRQSPPSFYSSGAEYPSSPYSVGAPQQVAHDTSAAFYNPEMHHTDFPNIEQQFQLNSSPQPLLSHSKQRQPKRSKSSHPPPQPHPPLPPRPNYDAQPQEITNIYEDYKWSITLYTLDPSQNFPYAQSFLDALITTTFPSQPHNYKWASHSTRGFIEHGTRFSLLVLHNAANPFTWGSAPESTTTIGVYGRYWYLHEDIHWITFAPGLADVLGVAQQQGIIAVARKWECDMPAREKRFHRAYWRAAR
ncbi:hypothetical protein T440DRAFT_360841, partial [Plenodomus tracheiphilus IPT5]